MTKTVPVLGNSNDAPDRHQSRTVVLNTHHWMCQSKWICQLRDTSVLRVVPDLSFVSRGVSFPLVPLAFTSPTTLLCKPSINTLEDLESACVCELTLPSEGSGADTGSICSGRELALAPSFLLKGDCHTLHHGGSLYISQREEWSITDPYFVRYDIDTRQWTQLEWGVPCHETLGAFALEGSLYYICRDAEKNNTCHRYVTDTHEWVEVALPERGSPLRDGKRPVATAVTSDGVVHLITQSTVRVGGSGRRRTLSDYCHYTFSAETGFVPVDTYREEETPARTDLTAVPFGRHILLAGARPFDEYSSAMTRANKTLDEMRREGRNVMKSKARRTLDTLAYTPSSQLVLDTVTGEWLTDWEVPKGLSHASVLHNRERGGMVYIQHDNNMAPDRELGRELHYAECDNRILYPSPSMLWARVKDM
ncbi:hypothetical protein KIPB_009145 [Kipferlia bialata]|uniref:Kelch-type beta propeller n=1 Tax=Kipferlia bialata TaxID=797122 RepID=A0A9K3D3W2_9EUKA|nr:hypothetical protein KIPB_009145 [Kipferlia bialata]|eukprot:g9145.t1